MSEKNYAGRGAVAGQVERRVSPLVEKREERRMPSFDTEAFMKKLTHAANLRGKTMKEVAAETGVSETTLSRMSSGKRVCDAASLAALSAWAGINPARFSGLVLTPRRVDEVAASTRLRANVLVTGQPLAGPVDRRVSALLEKRDDA